MAAESRGRRETVALTGLRYFLPVGILPHEASLAQPLEADVSVTRLLDHAPSAMELLDYRELEALVTGVVGARVELLETTAHAIADTLIARLDVARVQVTLRKPHVALGRPLAHAAVTVERTRVP